MAKPNWKNTIHNNGDIRHSIKDLAGFCYSVGYDFILWNDRIYEVFFNHHAVKWVDTGLTIHDMPEPVPSTEKVVVACYLRTEPVMIAYNIACTSEERDNGDHYVQAIVLAEAEGCIGNFVCYDESEFQKVISMGKTLTEYLR